MKQNRMPALILTFLLLLCFAACGQASEEAPLPLSSAIYLYGEAHAVEEILEEELTIWKQHYESGMRHLFVELGYCTAGLLNQWMQAEDDQILDEIYEAWSGTLAHAPCVKAFYQAIKTQCPETVFHGTDVEHQYHTVGTRYLRYLEEEGLEASDAYRQAQTSVQQGKTYYDKKDSAYRENVMTENFIRAFDQLESESVMGIYGAAHVELDAMDHATGSVPTMASQLEERYGDSLHTEYLLLYEKETEPERVDRMTVDGKEYEASYFGRQDLTKFFEDYVYRDFWRLEDAYEDFQDCLKTGDYLPDHNYPMRIEKGQVYVIDYLMTDGTVLRKLYRNDGGIREGAGGEPVQITEEFSLS